MITDPDASCYICALYYPRARNIRWVGKVAICENCARMHFPRPKAVTVHNARLTFKGTELHGLTPVEFTYRDDP